MSTNPYAAPKAAVAEATVTGNGDFVPGGQSVEAGRGWAWIAEGWELFKRQPGMWIGMVLVFFLIVIATAFIPFLGGLLMTLFGPVFAAGFIIGCRTLEEGGRLELGHLFAGFRDRTGTLIGVGAIYLGITVAVMLFVGLIMGVGAFTMMGGNPENMAAMGMTAVLAMLIMFALMLPAVMAIWMAAPLVVFHDHGAIDAMKGSFFGCLKNILPFLLNGVILFVLSILATIPLGLGWLVLAPVFAASVYASYRDIYLKPRA